jgi:hypothetical protein
MKYYIDNKGEVFAYESDGSQDNLIGDKNLISDEEFAELKKQKQQDAFDSLSYAEKRRLEYPPIEDYADAWVKNDEVALEKYRQSCLAVKTKYPKIEN